MNEIDRIWATPREELEFLPPKDIDMVIAHYKKLMGQVDAGEKPKKGAPPKDVDLADIIDVPATPKPTFTRRKFI